MKCKLMSHYEERDNPPNREVALVWTLHQTLERLNQFAHEPEGYRGKDFSYGLSILKAQIDSYIAADV